MKGLIALDKMSDDDLRQVVEYMERRADGPAANIAAMTRFELVRYAESLRPFPQKTIKVKKFKKGKKRMKRNLGIAKFCLALLKQVVGRTEEGRPVGLSYKKMVQMAQRKFPDSAIDEKHMRWYAHRFRDLGEIIPAHRERSSWI